MARNRHGLSRAVEGVRVTTAYDPVNRTQAVQDQLGYRTTYGYDPDGRNMTIQDARGNFITLVYTSRRGSG